MTGAAVEVAKPSWVAAGGWDLGAAVAHAPILATNFGPLFRSK